MKFNWRFVANRAARMHFVVVSTPNLAFCARFVETHEPVRVHMFNPEPTAEGFVV